MKHKKLPKFRVQVIEPKEKFVLAEKDIVITRMIYPKKKVKVFLGYKDGEKVYTERIVKDFDNPRYEVVKTIKKGEYIRTKKNSTIVHINYPKGENYELRIPLIKGIREVLEIADAKYGKGQLKKARHYAKRDAAEARKRRLENEK